MQIKFTLLIVSVIFAFICGAASNEIAVIAHRGNSSVAPENTLAAFRSAWENGIKCIELDVHRTKDDALVCIHDSHFKRLSPGADKTPVREMTLTEVKKFDVGKKKGEKFIGEKVPTLEEVLAIQPKDVTIFLEMKEVPDDFPLTLMGLLKKYNIPQKQIVVISFKSKYLIRLNEISPGFKTLLLSGIGNSKKNPAVPAISAEKLIARLKKFGVNGIDCAIGTAVTREYVQKVQAAGFEFHVWTIDKPEDVQRVKALGVNGITTNRPVFVKKILAE